MTVFSKMHIMEQNISTRGGTRAHASEFIQGMKKLPAFVIQEDAIEMMHRVDCGKAIQAMKEANILKLPYREMRIEYCIRKGRPIDLVGNLGGALRCDLTEYEPVHEFISLREKGDAIEAEYAFLFTKNNIGGLFEDRLLIDYTTEGLLVSHDKNIEPRLRDLALGAALLSLNIALVMMNMTGIEREVHHFEALNKQRIKKKKPTISQYSYVRIGHVYRADGTSVKYNSGDIRTMPMHVRCAHTRRQHYGKNNEETKLIYVPSVIVNFQAGKDYTPKQRIVKA